MIARALLFGAALSSADDSTICARLSADYAIVAGSSWGSAPPRARIEYRRLGCDDVVGPASADGRRLPSRTNGKPPRHRAPRPQFRRKRPPAPRRVPKRGCIGKNRTSLDGAGPKPVFLV